MDEFLYDIGDRIGHWTVIGLAIKTRKKPRGFNKRFPCRCVCGKERDVLAGELKKGNSKSCGCKRRNFVTHDLSGTPEYLVWLRMKQRCYDPNSTRFENWGGRGIAVCDRWKHSFETFYTDMGKRPKGHYSLDRIDNSKGYSPDNCRWASRKEQARNSRKARLLTHDGDTLCIAEWSERTGLNSTTIRQRIDAYGWSIEKALTTPVQKRKRGMSHAEFIQFLEPESRWVLYDPIDPDIEVWPLIAKP